ncbi:MAG TPA: hypothetical protein VGZ29_10595 [Terriglobia bacterium]|nr:hypothetical protein [Terriglobia bacterium]
MRRRASSKAQIGWLIDGISRRWISSGPTKTLCRIAAGSEKTTLIPSGLQGSKPTSYSESTTSSRAVADQRAFPHGRISRKPAKTLGKIALGSEKTDPPPLKIFGDQSQQVIQNQQKCEKNAKIRTVSKPNKANR